MKPAFIRLVTEDLINYLFNQGYSSNVSNRSIDSLDDIKDFGIATSIIPIAFDKVFYELKYTIIPISSFDNTNPHRSWNTAGRIDCGTDIENFKRITKTK